MDRTNGASGGGPEEPPAPAAPQVNSLPFLYYFLLPPETVPFTCHTDSSFSPLIHSFFLFIYCLHQAPLTSSPSLIPPPPLPQILVTDGV